jgi:RNase P subunit RPR2
MKNINPRRPIKLFQKFIPGKPLKPHPAATFLKAVPNSPTLPLTCESCGEEYIVPADRGDCPHGIFDEKYTSCPSCGTITRYEIELR